MIIMLSNDSGKKILWLPLRYFCVVLLQGVEENNVSVRERKYLSGQRKSYPANSDKILQLEDACRRQKKLLTVTKRIRQEYKAAKRVEHVAVVKDHLFRESVGAGGVGACRNIG